MQKNGGSVFGLPVPDPEKFGVIELDNYKNIVGIEEKPSKPKSNLIIPGLYFFDSEASKFAKTLIFVSKLATTLKNNAIFDFLK